MSKNQVLKMHVKKGDYVKVISGKNKGKTGEIVQILRKKSQVIIKDINLKIKHIRPKNKEESGQIINIEAPIHSSNVQLFSKKEQINSRYNNIINKKNGKHRVLKKTGEIIY